MRKTLLNSLILIGVVTTSTSTVLAQIQAPAAQVEPKPKTKIENFIAQDGAVIIQGFSTTGELKGEYSTQVIVKSKEFILAQSGRKEYGITVEVKESRRSIERDNTSYVDYDEIASLIKGLDYIDNVGKDVTKLDNFQADYRTRGDLKMSTFSSSGGDGEVMLAVQSGTIGATTAYFKKADIASLRTLLTQAKAKIDGIKAN